MKSNKYGKCRLILRNKRNPVRSFLLFSAFFSGHFGFGLPESLRLGENGKFRDGFTSAAVISGQFLHRGGHFRNALPVRGHSGMLYQRGGHSGAASPVRVPSGIGVTGTFGVPKAWPVERDWMGDVGCAEGTVGSACFRGSVNGF